MKTGTTGHGSFHRRALRISTDGSNEKLRKERKTSCTERHDLARGEKRRTESRSKGAHTGSTITMRRGRDQPGRGEGRTLYRTEENVYDAFGNEETGMKETVSSVQNDIKFTGATLDNSGTYSP